MIMANPLTEGRKAAADGLRPADCPYPAKDDRARSWQRGYELVARERGLCPWCGGNPVAGHVCDIRDAVREFARVPRTHADENPSTQGGTRMTTSRGTSAKIRRIDGERF